MIGDHARAPLIEGVGLLERAVAYTLGSLQLITPEDMGAPSPCRDWDLQELLHHMNDSLAALHEAVEVRHVALAPPVTYGDPVTDPVSTLRDRACSMLGSWANADTELVSVATYPLTAGVVTATGAVEVTVHGWDVAHACGRVRPIPDQLAEELLPLAELLVSENDRPARFATAVPVPPWAGPAERLLAYLGRQSTTE
jgi:uncharacterized protein (TIGR03086 family)